MSYIQQTTVSITYSLDDGQERHSTTNFRYFQMYGWSPWVTPFHGKTAMLQFSILVYITVPTMTRGAPTTVVLDSAMNINAAITHMTDFASSGDRIAVWRSVRTSSAF